jgi:hypothetical protein
MLTHEELAFIKALSTGNFSVAFFKILMTTGGKKKRPAVTTRNRGITASQRRSSSGKRKATELASDSSEPATRRPATGAGSSPKQRHTENATGEQSASGGRQLGSPEGGMTYVAVEASPVVPQLPSGTLKPSAKGSDPSEPAVS